MQNRVAHPQRRVRIERPNREVLGHPLHEPEGQALCCRISTDPAGVARGGDVELKGVHQLVADDVIGVGERAAERQDHAPSKRFGDAARALADLTADRIGLLEVRVRRIEDERLASAQLVLQYPPQPRAPAFRHARGDGGGVPLLLVEVHVEVLGPQHLELERAVLDLVAAEVLLGGGGDGIER